MAPRRLPALLALVGLLDALTVHRSRVSAVTDGDDLIRFEPRTDRRPLARTDVVTRAALCEECGRRT